MYAIISLHLTRSMPGLTVASVVFHMMLFVISLFFSHSLYSVDQTEMTFFNRADYEQYKLNPEHKLS